MSRTTFPLCSSPPLRLVQIRKKANEGGSSSAGSQPGDAHEMPEFGTQRNAGLGPPTRNKKPVASFGSLHPFPTSVGWVLRCDKGGRTWP